MSIKASSDLGSPVIVWGIDQLSKRYTDWNEWITYAESAAGYLGAWFNKGGDMVKNIGVASLPLTLNHITERVKGGMTSQPVRKLAYKVARYPAPAGEAPFAGVKLT